MALVRCTVCERTFDPAESRTMPFCSARCRTIDLNRWLGEGYGLPYENPEDESPPEIEEE